jgi:probable phosphoglycerate mutase
VIDPARLPPIYFLRHGETDWNRARRIQGQTDVPLNETGLEQARRMAARLAEIVPKVAAFELVASPLERARATMREVCAAYGVGEEAVRYDARLSELSFGEVEGKVWADLPAFGIVPETDPERYFDWRPANGESYGDARLRVASWLAGLERPTVVVSHGGISRILRGLVFALPKREVVALPVPQDRFFRIEAGLLDWFDATDPAT